MGCHPADLDRDDQGGRNGEELHVDTTKIDEGRHKTDNRRLEQDLEPIVRRSDRRGTYSLLPVGEIGKVTRIADTDNRKEDGVEEDGDDDDHQVVGQVHLTVVLKRGDIGR